MELAVGEGLDYGAAVATYRQANIRIIIVLRSLRQFPSGEAFAIGGHLHVVQTLLLDTHSIIPATRALEALGVRVFVDVMLIIKLRLRNARCNFVGHLRGMIKTA